MLQRNDHLVNVEQGDVLVAVHVPVETVVVGDELVLALAPELALEVHVLKDGHVGLVAGQRDGGHLDQPLGAVVVKHLSHVRMDFEVVEKNFISTESSQHLEPFS